jgi:hypothetical protein
MRREEQPRRTYVAHPDYTVAPHGYWPLTICQLRQYRRNQTSQMPSHPPKMTGGSSPRRNNSDGTQHVEVQVPSTLFSGVPTAAGTVASGFCRPVPAFLPSGCGSPWLPAVSGDLAFGASGRVNAAGGRVHLTHGIAGPSRSRCRRLLGPTSGVALAVSLGRCAPCSSTRPNCVVARRRGTVTRRRRTAERTNWSPGCICLANWQAVKDYQKLGSKTAMNQFSCQLKLFTHTSRGLHTRT